MMELNLNKVQDSGQLKDKLPLKRSTSISPRELRSRRLALESENKEIINESEVKKKVKKDKNETKKPKGMGMMPPPLFRSSSMSPREVQLKEGLFCKKVTSGERKKLTRLILDLKKYDKTLPNEKKYFLYFCDHVKTLIVSNSYAHFLSKLIEFTRKEHESELVEIMKTFFGKEIDHGDIPCMLKKLNSHFFLEELHHVI